MREPYRTISISIPSKILAQVDQTEGKSRNDKLVTCIRKGYELLTNTPIQKDELRRMRP